MVFVTVCTILKTYFESSFHLVYEIETVLNTLSYKEGANTVTCDNGDYIYMVSRSFVLPTLSVFPLTPMSHDGP